MNKILIAGPCVGEHSEQWIVDQAGAISAQLEEVDREYDWVFKCSFDKANRTHGNSYRGLGLDVTLRALERVKKLFGCMVTTDIHEVYQAHELRGVVDVIQIPAMLSRQTDLIRAAANNAHVVNIKCMTSGSPQAMELAAHKITGQPWLTYRGTAYGSTLTFDLGHLLDILEADRTTIVDVTHIAQNRFDMVAPNEMTNSAALCAAALGVDGLFMECHSSPEEALSDSGTQLPIQLLAGLLEGLPWPK